jgi:hypothetical protein
VETFTAPRAFVKNSRYNKQRRESFQKLDLSRIDHPIIDIVHGFSKLQYCFTLQSCYGHFLYPGNRDPDNIEPLPVENGIESIEYRIAYLAICIEDSNPGKELFDNLGEIPSVDPEYIQLGSADWFWERQLNSYVLQVEPLRHMTRDRCLIDYGEALHVEKIRNQFFKQLTTSLRKRLGD